MTAALRCRPECRSTDAAEGLRCLSHLDRGSRETGPRMLFMSFPVKISPHSGQPVFSPLRHVLKGEFGGQGYLRSPVDHLPTGNTEKL